MRSRNVCPGSCQNSRLALAASMLAISGSVQAHLFCVSTAAEFQDALTQSSGTYSGEDNYITLVGGTYQTGAATGNAPFLYSSPSASNSINIYGGYAAACEPRTEQTPRTMLDGGGSTGVLVIRNTNGGVVINGLVLQNGESDQPGAGLQVNYLVSANGSVAVSDTIIRNNHATSTVGGLYVSAGTTAVFTANLIAGNSADSQYGAGFVTCSGQNSLFYNNTVTQNTSAAPTTPIGGLYCGGAAACEVHNSIFWNNTTYGLYLGNSGAFLSYNDVGTLGGVAPDIDSHNLSVTPQFVNPNSENFRLAGDSPLLGIGILNGTSYDLDGYRYPTSGKVDLGPYERTIFIDGFDGV